MVSQGLWKDYSISFLKDFAVFSVYRKYSDWALFSIKKTPKNSKYGKLYSIVAMDGRILKCSNDLKSTLRVLRYKELKFNIVYEKIICETFKNLNAPRSFHLMA